MSGKQFIAPIKLVSLLAAVSLGGCGGDDSGNSAASLQSSMYDSQTSGITVGTATPESGSSSNTPPVQASSKQIAVPTPVMGWASWNAYGCNITEGKIKAAADYMESSGLKTAGYRYVNVDDCWAALSRDAQGNLAAHPTTFPSGMSALGDYIHSKGLKFGIYGSPGPKTCAELNTGRNYPGVTGSFGYEAQDANIFAKWGVDFLKYDWCWPNKVSTAEAQVPYFQKMRDALNATGRDIVYSINPNSYGPANAGRAYYWGNVSDMWRTTDDIVVVPPTGAITASFGRVVDTIFQGNFFPQAQHTGAYNDPDMMMVAAGMTSTEDQTHFSLWAIAGAPLILGNAFSPTAPLSSETLSLVTNPEVIAVDQDGLGLQGIVVDGNAPGLQVIAKPLMGSGRRAVVLLNDTSVAAPMTVTWAQLGFATSSAGAVRDIWAHKDLGTFTGSYTAPVVPAHGVVMLTIDGVDGPATTYSPSQLSGTSAWISCATCASGKIVSALGSVTFNNVASSTTGGYVQIAYQNKGSQSVKANLSVNGGAKTVMNFPPSGNDGTVGLVTVYAPLTLSANSIAISQIADGAAAPDIHSISVVSGPVAYKKPAVAYEAESSVNSIAGGAKVASCSSCSGGKSVGYIGNGGTLTFNGISIQKSGAYSVPILYANGNTSPRSAQISVNGAPPVTVSFQPTGSFASISVARVTAVFNAGTQNTLTISNPSGWAPDIDGIGTPVLQ